MLTISRFLDPKNDLPFKRLFGSEKNKDILIYFLNDIFARATNPIEESEFIKPNRPRNKGIKVSYCSCVMQRFRGQ